VAREVKVMLADSSALNIGTTAYMLICSALVMLMTPGLAFFYGGLVTKKNVLTVMIQSFASLCWATILWFCIGYSMCFGPTWHGIVGDPTYLALLKGVSLYTMYSGNNAGIPLGVHFIYQMMFAIIAPALITGAFANRVNFNAYLLFLTPWLIFVYFPFAHMVWSPDGLFARMGVLDFAGGIVVHTTAGFAALASVVFIGRRCDTTDMPRRHLARSICCDELESTRCGRPVVGRHSVLSWAVRCRRRIGGLGLCLHLCGAVVD
jgi:Amt family ammonium transporter